MRSPSSLFLVALLVGALPYGPQAWAQALPGFQVNHYEPTPAGQASFMVEQPRFSPGTLAVGLTLSYAHRPLVLSVEEEDGRLRTLRVLIEHQLVGWLNVSGSVCDCLTLTASLPLVLLERGQHLSGSESPSGSAGSRDANTLGGFSPASGLEANDPRLGATFRVYGHPERDPFSASVSGHVWIPARRFLGGDSHSGDGQTRGMATLVLAGVWQRMSWALTGGYLLRPVATLDIPGVGVTGPEARAGAALRYSDTQHHFSIGPEVQLSTLVQPRSLSFKPFYTNVEALLGLHLDVHDSLQLGMAAGAGFLRQPGTPDFRLVVQVVYVRRDPPVPPRISASLPAPHWDGVSSAVDARPTTQPLGPGPDLKLPVEPSGEDGDKDDVPDPTVAGPTSVEVPGDVPPESGPAAPVVVPPVEVPPVVVVPPVEVLKDRLRINQSVTFAVGQDVVLPESIPVLQAVAAALKANPRIRRIRIEGHTDNVGNDAWNLVLSRQRAEAIARWLKEQGHVAVAMETEGFGASRPVADNATEAGRATNRRVELLILEQGPSRQENP